MDLSISRQERMIVGWDMLGESSHCLFVIIFLLLVVIVVVSSWRAPGTTLALVRSRFLGVTRLVLGSHGLVLSLGGASGDAPLLAQLLGYLTHGVLGVGAAHLWSLVVAEPEESGQSTLGRIRVLGALLSPDDASLALGHFFQKEDNGLRKTV